MGDLKPIGSEKLEGVSKLKRIMEIAKYKENINPNNIELSTSDYKISLPDGYTYEIVKEKLGYTLKKGINENYMDYITPMKSRKFYRSYSEALKKLNLIVSEVNRSVGNDYEIPLIGEQGSPKKKFVLKQTKTNPTTPESPTMGAEEMPPPPAPEMGAEEMPPAPEMGTEGMPPAPEMGAEGVPPAPEEGTEGMPPSPEMGGAPMEEPPMPEMGGEEPPMPEMGGEEPMMGGEEEGEEPSSIKVIQKLTGKLAQKIRALEKDQGLDSQDKKYVLNSLISAIKPETLDDDDKEDIIDKIEAFDEYGGEGEGDLNFDDENMSDMGGMMGNEEGVPPSPEMGAEEMPPAPEEGMPQEPVEGYQNIMDSIFTESRVENVLSKYFKIKPNEKPILEHKKKVDYLKQKLNIVEQKKDYRRMSETQKQTNTCDLLFEQYKNINFVGKTNKNNLVFQIGNKQIKVTPHGRVI
jgi:hypothetical protein